MAGHQRYQAAEHHALAEADPVIRQRYRTRQRLDEVAGRHPQLQLGRAHAAEQRDRVGPDHQQRHRNRQRDDLRQHQPEAVRQAHHQHRIEFFGDPHHAQLGGNRRAGTPGHQDRRQQRPEFADDAHAQDIYQVNVAAEGVQLLRRQVRQHHADQKPHQRGDAERLKADMEDVRRYFFPRTACRIACELAEVQHQLPDQADEAVDVFEKPQHRAAQSDQRRQPLRRLRRQCQVASLRQPLEKAFLPGRQRQLDWPDFAPQIPEKLGADVVETFNAATNPIAQRCRPAAI